MNQFKTILIKLKEIIAQPLKADKVRDKNVAVTLNIKASRLAGMKCRGKQSYQAILTYCHNNKLDVRKILFDEVQPIIDYPTQVPIEDSKISVKYFRTLDAYGRYLSL